MFLWTGKKRLNNKGDAMRATFRLGPVALLLWPSDAWERGGKLRRRFLALTLACLCLCGCAVWPEPMLSHTGMRRTGEQEWCVWWRSWGKDCYVFTSQYETAARLDALLWRESRRIGGEKWSR